MKIGTNNLFDEKGENLGSWALLEAKTLNIIEKIIYFHRIEKKRKDLIW